MENQSKYDPTRKTVGAIYRDAQINGDFNGATIGDLTAELQSSLVSDLNDTIASNPYDNRAFYITIHEKKDLQMPNAILRRMLTSLYRPYPEDDTVVFYVNPAISEVKFCWCLPHWSEMDNMLENESLYNKELIREIRAWKAHDLYQFGFTKNEIGDWMANPIFKDKPLVESRPQILLG